MARNITKLDLDIIKRDIKTDPAVQEAAAEYLRLQNEHTEVMTQNREISDVHTRLKLYGDYQKISERVAVQEKRPAELSNEIHDAQKKIHEAIKDTVKNTGALDGVSRVDNVNFDLDRFTLIVKKEIITSMDHRLKPSEKAVRGEALAELLDGMLNVAEKPTGKAVNNAHNVDETLLPEANARAPIVQVLKPAHARAANQ